MELATLKDAEEVKEEYEAAQVSVSFHVSIVWLSCFLTRCALRILWVSLRTRMLEGTSSGSILKLNSIALVPLSDFSSVPLSKVVTVDPTIEILKDLPARMERAIYEVDKQSKNLNKDDVGPEQTLKALLTKLN